MEKQNDLLNGNITKTLTKLTIPIVATSLMQMAYSMIDMIWIGRLGANAVAAVGVAGMFGWLSNGLAMIPRVGGQVKVGHSLGQKDQAKALSYASSAIKMGIIFALAFGLLLSLNATLLIDFFKLNATSTINNAISYLQITCGLIIFSFINQILTGLFNATGDSHTPFLANSIGLVLNLVLDPILIFGLLFFPKLGVIGAAVATVFAQFIVTISFIIKIIKNNIIFKDINLFKKYSFNYYQDIFKIGLPIALQNMLFSMCSMIIAKFIAGYGDGAIAAQKIGTQIEAISWHTADGFEAAINAFIAQNYGGHNYQRVKDGYKSIIKIAIVWGLICSFVLIVFPAPIFNIFLSDGDVLKIGVRYLTIIGISQVFMVVEITTSGAFSGLGNSFPPSIISIIFTLGRIPLIMILTLFLGLDGIWWAISLSSIIKGIVSYTWFHYYKKQKLQI